MNKDIRWIQRFNNYKKALGQLREAVDITKERPLSKLEQQGLIQVFEFTHELAWNTLKDFLEESGNEPMYGSKDATRKAFRAGLIHDGGIWMQMIESRNKSSHTYNQGIADEVAKEIIVNYLNQFEILRDKLEDHLAGEER